MRLVACYSTLKDLVASGSYGEIVYDGGNPDVVTVHRYAPVKRTETIRVVSRGTHAGGVRDYERQLRAAVR